MREWSVIMKSLSIFLLFSVPHIVFADCILTESPGKYEVVCSGYNPMSPQTGSKMNTKKSTRSGKAKKSNYEDRESATMTAGMNNEELQFMQARNKMDGYRAKVKPKDQLARK
jgi:hypothetical protein